MIPEATLIKRDRMRYTKDKLSANLIITAIVLDALYFVAVYQTDVENYYYNWVIGASIIYNLLFLLIAFLASEGVKNRKSGYTGTLIGLGLMQVVRVFYLPAKAHSTVIAIGGVDTLAMSDAKYLFSVVCLVISGICCVVAALTSYKNNKTLAEHMRYIENQSA